MATTTKTTTKAPDAAEAARLELERLEAEEAAGGRPSADVTPRQAAVAAELRERDHAEGCPVLESPDGPARVEAYAETVLAPGPELRRLGLAKGDTVIVVRCNECGSVRYRAGYANLTAFVKNALRKAAGIDKPNDDSELDTEL